MLPADNPVQAVRRVLALDTAEDLLSRDYSRLDLRNENRPTIRLSDAALAAYREMHGLKTEVKATQ